MNSDFEIKPMRALWRFIGLVVLLTLLALAWRMLPAIGADPHEHAADGPSALQLDNGKKWATDDSLRLAMKKIRDSVQKQLPQIHDGKLSNKGYDGLAKEVNDQVAYMVKNCRLPQDADAMLHLLLVDLLQGAEQMQGKTANAPRMGGAVKVVQALGNYDTYFEHPGWRPIEH